MYFLFPCVGRFDDIYAGYYLQAKHFGHLPVVYTPPTVYQVRNKHDFVSDFQAEYEGIELAATFPIALKNSPDNLLNILPKRAVKAFEVWRKEL